jgi:hypothetical protein
LPRDRGRHDRYAGYTYGYNRPLIAWRVHDLLTAVAFARDLEGARSIRLLGLDRAGPWVVLARALAPAVVERAAVTWGWDFDELSSLDDQGFLPGAVRHGGLASFAALSAPEPLLLIGASEAPAIVESAYRAAGATEALRLEGTELVRFLSGP